MVADFRLLAVFLLTVVTLTSGQLAISSIGRFTCRCIDMLKEKNSTTNVIIHISVAGLMIIP